MAQYLTKPGLARLKKELDYLETVTRREVAERIGLAAAQGDLKENAGYDSAKEEQGFLERRIKELKNTLAQARVIEAGESSQAQIGSFVCLEEGKEKIKFQIVGPEEVDISNNKISFKSPLGSAILNKKEGDTVKINTPKGAKNYKIFSVSSA